MKKIMLILMTACITMFATPSKATVSVRLGWFASWDVVVNQSCQSGYGVCIQILIDGIQDAAFTVLNKTTLSSSLNITDTTDPSFAKFVQGGYLVLPVNSNIDPRVTTKEGLSGNYAVPAGKYLLTKNANGSYTFNFTLVSAS